MPNYFFHVREGRHSRSDTVGLSLPDIREARRAGFVLAGTLLAGPTRKFWHLTTWSIDVTDDDMVLMTLMFFRSVAAGLSWRAPDVSGPTYH